ncbi:MAG: hypothetical protein IT210_08910 [Armatimonadetes bacterium]|nr:hypothetical protein [Armatimonadota bacterium]
MASRWMRGFAAGIFLTAVIVTVVVAQQPGPGGPGGFRNMMANMAMGTVVAIDLNNKAVQVQSSFGQAGARWVVIGSQTKMYRQVKSKVEDLKEGDQITVQGVPTAITARDMQIGEMPSFSPMPQGGGPGGGAARPRMQTNAMVAGKVTKLDPLTITTQDKVEVAVSVPENAQIVKITSATFRDIKQRDNFIAAGEPDEEGNLYAHTVGVGLSMGPMGGFRGMGGMGGFMGGPPMGGPGGGGMAPPPPPQGETSEPAPPPPASE